MTKRVTKETQLAVARAAMKFNLDFEDAARLAYRQGSIDSVQYYAMDRALNCDLDNRMTKKLNSLCNRSETYE